MAIIGKWGRGGSKLTDINQEKSADYESSEFMKRLVYFSWIQGFFQPGNAEI